MIGTLLFIGTIFGLLGSFVYMIITLFNHRVRRTFACLLGCVVWLGIYTLIMMTISFTTPQMVLARGQEHCFDEMCFSVQDATTTRILGTGTHAQLARGIYYIVTVQLRNAARQASQKPDQPAFYLTDAAGYQYSPSSAGQHAIGQYPQWNQRLQPGEEQTREVVFDVPLQIQQPHLIVTEGSWPTPLIIGDENSFFHPKTAFSLAP
jgi:heme/copper-type cytochrome/quinol oxidase subunit 1